jgi:hypothetical protein
VSKLIEREVVIEEIGSGPPGYLGWANAGILRRELCRLLSSPSAERDLGLRERQILEEASLAPDVALAEVVPLSA